jgi:hypothetical protein
MSALRAAARSCLRPIRLSQRKEPNHAPNSQTHNAHLARQQIAILAACGGAPAPQSSVTPASGAAAPTAASAPTAANSLTKGAAATAAPTTQASTNAEHPNDATQARLRLAHFDLAGSNVDLFVNGAKAVNVGQAQINIPSGYVNGYLFLAPATYRVAVVPTGKPLDQALIGPLDVPLVAGHHYTLVMLRQLKDNTFKPLVIDETAAEQQLGAKPTDIVRIAESDRLLAEL